MSFLPSAGVMNPKPFRFSSVIFVIFTVPFILGIPSMFVIAERASLVLGTRADTAVSKEAIQMFLGFRSASPSAISNITRPFSASSSNTSSPQSERVNGYCSLSSSQIKHPRPFSRSMVSTTPRTGCVRSPSAPSSNFPADICAIVKISFQRELYHENRMYAKTASV